MSNDPLRPHRPGREEFEDVIRRLREADEPFEQDLPAVLSAIGGTPSVAYVYGAITAALKLTGEHVGGHANAHVALALAALQVEVAADVWDAAAPEDEGPEQREIRWRKLTEEARSLEAAITRPSRHWVLLSLVLFFLSWEFLNELKLLPTAPPEAAEDQT